MVPADEARTKSGCPSRRGAAHGQAVADLFDAGPEDVFGQALQIVAHLLRGGQEGAVGQQGGPAK